MCQDKDTPVVPKMTKKEELTTISTHGMLSANRV